MNRNILIDGNNLLHRAKAIFVDGAKTSFHNRKGYPTGLIYGSLSMLTDWIGAIDHPTQAILFLDGEPKKRRSIDPTYKQKDTHEDPVGRTEYPVQLLDGFSASNEIDIISHILQLFGVDTIYDPAEEADDLIASFVKQNPDDINIILSSDKDFYQIASDKVILYRPGIEGNRFFDLEKVEDHLYEIYGARVPVSAVRLLKSLTGDKSDNIVGVPRLRKKIVAPLCSAPNVDAFFATGLPGFSKAEKEKTESLRSRIAVNYELTGLIQDIDLTPRRKHTNPDADTARRILSEDLQISGIDIYVLRFGYGCSIRTSDADVGIRLIPDSTFDDI